MNLTVAAIENMRGLNPGKTEIQNPTWKDLIINSGAIIPKKFAKNYLSKMSDDEMENTTDNMSDYFLEMIRKDSPKIDFKILEKRLKIKYMYDGHSAMILNGRKGVQIIVDHEMPNPWSEINCKTEIKLFEKCGMKVSDFRIREKIYSYVIESEEEFYKELRKMPDTFWFDKSKVTKTISAGTSILPDESGIILRILGNKTEDVSNLVFKTLEICRKKCLGSTFSKIRKN